MNHTDFAMVLEMTRFEEPFRYDCEVFNVRLDFSRREFKSFIDNSVTASWL